LATTSDRSLGRRARGVTITIATVLRVTPQQRGLETIKERVARIIVEVRLEK